MSSYEFLAITKFMDDFRQNSPPWRDDDDDGACSIGLLVAHALQFTVFSSLDMSAYVMQCSALCPLECGLLHTSVCIHTRIRKACLLLSLLQYYLLHTVVHSSVLYIALARSAGVQQEQTRLLFDVLRCMAP